MPVVPLLVAAAFASLWVVLPITGLVMAIITVHTLGILRAGPDVMPPLRRRIRLANGLLLYMLTPLLAYGCGIATPDEPRIFVYVWTIIAVLAALVLMLALLDASNIAAEHRRRIGQLHGRLDRLSATSGLSSGGVPKGGSRTPPANSPSAGSSTNPKSTPQDKQPAP